ncbi:tyrosine-type recombinase/integrase [Blastococcus mobilis]|nr:tyrosine-type recombinase/integrase [Blastococcus mobilis]
MSDAVHDGLLARTRARDARHPGRVVSGPTSPRPRKSGRCTTRSPSTCAPPSCSGRSSGCAPPRRSRCALRTSTSCGASCGRSVRVTASRSRRRHRVRRFRSRRNSRSSSRQPWPGGAASTSPPTGPAGRPRHGESSGRSARRGRKSPGCPRPCFHDLRHYLASLLIGSGLDVKVVQHRLQHGSATTTLDTHGHLCQTATSPHGPPLVLCWRPVGTRRGLLPPLGHKPWSAACRTQMS